MALSGFIHLAAAALLLLQVTSSGQAALVRGPTNTYVEVGSTVRIPCEASSASVSGAIAYTWTFNYSISLPSWIPHCIPLTAADDRCITNARVRYTGIFGCTATDVNTGFDLGTQSGDFVVLNPIIFAGKPQNQVVFLGHSVTFVCSLNTLAGSAATLSWWYHSLSGDVRVSASTRITITANSLKIAAVQENDLGRYYCVATNRATSRNESALLTTQGSSVPIFLGSIVPQTLTITAGTDITIPCKTTSTPSMALATWYHDSQQVFRTLPHLDIQQDNSLKITTLQAGDEGVYYCDARNTLGSSTSVTTTLKFPAVAPTPSSPESSGISSSERVIIIAASCGGGGLIIIVVVAVFLLRKPLRRGEVQRKSVKALTVTDVPTVTFGRGSMRDGASVIISKKSQRSTLEQRMSQSYSDKVQLMGDGDISALTNPGNPDAFLA